LHGIIDYSLLVGIHCPQQGIPQDQWVADNQEALTEVYQALLRAKGSFFGKDFGASGPIVAASLPSAIVSDLAVSCVCMCVPPTDFARFASYAYVHHEHVESSGRVPEAAAGPLSPKSQGSGGSSPTTSTVARLDAHKGIRAVKAEGDDSPDQVYFMGIIDTLVPFDARKKGEYVFKSIITGGSNFSVVPPEKYAQRFVDFMWNSIC
jgi:hypothetical protein